MTTAVLAQLRDANSAESSCRYVSSPSHRAIEVPMTERKSMQTTQFRIAHSDDRAARGGGWGRERGACAFARISVPCECAEESCFVCMCCALPSECAALHSVSELLLHTRMGAVEPASRADYSYFERRKQGKVTHT